jgi:hypothetical protein
MKYNNKPLILNQPLTGASLPAWLCGMAGLVLKLKKKIRKTAPVERDEPVSKVSHMSFRDPRSSRGTQEESVND